MRRVPCGDLFMKSPYQRTLYVLRSVERSKRCFSRQTGKNAWSARAAASRNRARGPRPPLRHCREHQVGGDGRGKGRCAWLAWGASRAQLAAPRRFDGESGSSAGGRFAQSSTSGVPPRRGQWRRAADGTERFAASVGRGSMPTCRAVRAPGAGLSGPASTVGGLHAVCERGEMGKQLKVLENLPVARLASLGHGRVDARAKLTLHRNGTRPMGDSSR